MSLGSDKRLNFQVSLDFSSLLKGEARQAGREDIESLPAANEPERPANTNRIMEEVCERGNLKAALRRVKANKGSAGVDGMTVNQLNDYLKQHWPAIREQLLNGTYEPQPVRRVEIPKPDGGVRKLGIPTTLDRFVQQGVMQVLQRRWDPSFSRHSYGFRPGRSAHQAVAQAQQYIAAGYEWVIDLDLEKFFDQVNHDKLMGQVAKRIEDKRLLKLIRAFLNAGVMENGLVSPSVEGTPQGGPLSPLPFGVREDTVRLWRSDFIGGGIAALKATVAPGPPPVKSEAALGVVTPLLEAPVADRRNWTIARLRAEIAGQAGITISRSQLSKVLRKKNFRWRRPRHTLKGRQIADKIERVGLRLQLRKAQAEAGDIVLLYGDESEALTHPYLARAWAKRGADLRVPAPGQAK